MSFTKEQIRTAYKKLPPETQSFIMDPDTTEVTDGILQNAGLSDDNTNLADSEILYAMYGLQTLSEAIANIAKISNKDMSELSSLKSDLEKNIFDKIPAENISLPAPDANRISEISQKYSLSPEQTDALMNYVKVSAENMKEVDATDMLNELSISRILAEQLVDELKSRVMNVSKKTPDSKPLKENRLPEVKPDNLPMIEIGEVSHPYTPEKRPERPAEPVQKPYSVPRFGINQVEPKVQVINMVNTQPANSQGMMDNKLNSVTTNAPVQEEKAPPSMPSTKYTADPYREPLN